MCLLIVVRGPDPAHPLLVASNRDEVRDRPASPPGLYVGARRRMLAPRDRRAGGTWLAVNDAGMLAGLTNVACAPARKNAPTRGRLPHLALDEDDVAGAVRAVEREVGRGRDNPFQLLVADAERTVVLRHVGGRLDVHDDLGEVVVLSNEHGPGELVIEVGAALAPGLAVETRLGSMRPILLDPGGEGRHPVLKKGKAWGTVSSSLIAIPRDGGAPLVWLYAAGPPDEVAYRDYGNLARRLRGSC